MGSHLIGGSVAIFVSLMWTVCSILFAAAGKRLGILGLNAFRTLVALGLLATSHLILMGALLPGANAAQWGVLMLSGIIGLGIGDFGYFGGLVNIGPRKALLIMSTHPIFSLAAAYALLGEVPGAWTGLGIAVTLTGVFTVVLEEGGAGERLGKVDRPDTVTRAMWRKGVFLAFVGAAGQGIGFVLAKYGMEQAGGSGSDLDPLSATLIRMMAACLFIWIVVMAGGRLSAIRASFSDRGALKLAAGGAFFGPFIGVWMSMVALGYLMTGVAATLMSLMPVIIIPVLWIVFRQPTNPRGILGAVIAVIGVGILFLA